MKILRLVLIVPALAAAIAPAIAAELNVGAYNLDGWVITGNRPPPAPSPQTLVLPADGSLRRTFPGSELAVRLKSRPVFGVTAENSPRLVIGQASLTFVRQEGIGKLELVVDQQAPEILAYSFQLDNEGQALAPVELEFKQAAGAVSVIFQGQETRRSLAAAANELEVIISSEGGQAWILDHLALKTAAPVPATALSPLPAQTSPAADIQALNAALLFRTEMADAVASGRETPAAALARLRAREGDGDPSQDASYAYELIDLGQRLVSFGKPVEAEPFFLAAEESLDALIKRTPDANARDKAEYLSRLSLIRWKFLNKVAQALRDIDQAILLPVPDDYLKQARENLLRSNAEFGKERQPEVKS